MSRSMSSPGLAESNRAAREWNGIDSAQTNKNKRRANQAVACPSWVVGGVRDERLQRVGELGRDYDYDQCGRAVEREKRKKRRAE